ncbi:periplasmic chaperone for outer membrane proteins Skp [Nicoletella semolina]|uniref:Periplasmic chaperone for outer membrane proteins Skp n=1 Tax=Nicoletella semolina TaxID=271160 RepID=A0A4R2NA25_9PAST|nr:OmpH family outer membrane protein [Nicoletella semolina]MDH2925379.1 hypothetical protein [Nicoletella semolina]TCP17857.1 periplasmic chaperone for outer membrane proteins Skp [Nicoletella semolina]
MKKVFKLAALTSAFLLSSNVAMAEETIAYVNPNYLMQNHPLLTDPNSDFVKETKAQEAKLAEEDKKLAEEEKKLTEEAKKLQEEEKVLTASLQKKIEALEKEAPRMRSADIKKRQDALNAEGQAFQKKVDAFQKREEAFRQKVAQFQQTFANVQREFDEKRANIQKSIVGEMETIIQDTAKAKGFSLVIDSSAVIYTKNDANDLTQVVFDTIKKNTPKPAAK